MMIKLQYLIQLLSICFPIQFWVIHPIHFSANLIIFVSDELYHSFYHPLIIFTWFSDLFEIFSLPLGIKNYKFIFLEFLFNFYFYYILSSFISGKLVQNFFGWTWFQWLLIIFFNILSIILSFEWWIQLNFWLLLLLCLFIYSKRLIWRFRNRNCIKFHIWWWQRAF